jgi:hypothetical protein
VAHSDVGANNDYSLGRWTALMHYLEDGGAPCDNSWVENRIRPIAIGRSNWLFAGSLRAAAIMSLIRISRTLAAATSAGNRPQTVRPPL